MKKLTLTTLIFLLAGSICAQTTTTWGETEHKGKPWVENTSRPNKITNGLQGRHFSIWASHGRYFDNAKCIWKWQRPILFGTTEDLFTPTIVVPYLMPMLENAGAIVFSPRERDWQANEVIVDNDTPLSSYAENNAKKKWKSTEEPGFAFHKGTYADGENPFTAGTSRQIKTRKKDTKLSSIVYKPNFPEEGRYAVYVSYQTMKKSTEAAQYIVRHKGSQTIFRVNQQMGGGTWVYLGTFDFDKGQNQRNCVILTNHSPKKGIVTADAVRFGGGMGNIQRGSQTSQLPRALEGARYYAQWAGAPREIVSKSGGSNDYTDDINVRSLMTNWLAGGSCYLPDHQGKNVPIELTLAIHSDAGVKADGSVVGTLGI
ncbi:MAG: xanthan lyase, partial [Prevotella micans]|nr:xanthan lyase [Prevotella micans]